MTPARQSLELPTFFGPPQVGRWIATWAGVRDVPDLELRLPKAAFLQPAGLALLAAGIADRQERALSTTLTGDDTSETFRYLERIDFLGLLGLRAAGSFERHAPGGRFVPLECIRDHATAHRLAEAAITCLVAQHPGFSPSLQRTARIVFEELGANIVDHSRRAATGFGVAQAYPKDQRIQIAFADAGVGFLASMQRNRELEGRIDDEGVAIQLALEKGVSGGQAGANIGWGLALLRSFVDQFAADLSIASGGVLLQRRTVAGARVNTLSPVSGWKGAFLCFDFKLSDA